jgi:hypothetical protein
LAILSAASCNRMRQASRRISRPATRWSPRVADPGAPGLVRLVVVREHAEFLPTVERRLGITETRNYLQSIMSPSPRIISVHEPVVAVWCRRAGEELRDPAPLITRKPIPVQTAFMAQVPAVPERLAVEDDVKERRRQGVNVVTAFRRGTYHRLGRNVHRSAGRPNRLTLLEHQLIVGQREFAARFQEVSWTDVAMYKTRTMKTRQSFAQIDELSGHQRSGVRFLEFLRVKLQVAGPIAQRQSRHELHESDELIVLPCCDALIDRRQVPPIGCWPSQAIGPLNSLARVWRENHLTREGPRVLLFDDLHNLVCSAVDAMEAFSRWAQEF